MFACDGKRHPCFFKLQGNAVPRRAAILWTAPFPPPLVISHKARRPGPHTKISVGGLSSLLEALVASILLCFPPFRGCSHSLAHEIFLLPLKLAMEDWVFLIVYTLTYVGAFIFHHYLDWFHPENLEKFSISTLIISAKYLLPWNATQSQFSDTRLWLYWGDILPITVKKV